MFDFKPNAFDRMYAMAESLAQALSGYFLKQSPRDFVGLETAYGEQTLVMDDGSLISAIRIDGNKSAVHQQEYEKTCIQMEAYLRAIVNDGAHKLTWYFSVDNDKIEDELNHIYTNEAKRVAGNLGFLDTALIQEQADAIANYCHLERNLLIVRTYTRALTQVEKNQLSKEVKKANQGNIQMLDAQILNRGVEHYINKHLSLCSTLVDLFNNLNISARVMTNHEYLYELRNAYDSAWTDRSWKPYLPGDKYPLRLNENLGLDYSGVGIPTLKEQLIPRMMDVNFHHLATIGETVYAPLSVKFTAQSPRPFSELYVALKRAEIPYRITFDIDTDGVSLLVFKDIIASILIFPPASNNKQLVEAADRLRKLRDDGEEIVKLRVNLCTWAYQKDDQLAAKRREMLAKQLQAWGNMEPEQVEGDVAESIVSSIPGLSRGNAASPIPDALSSVIQMLPHSQLASIWEKGSRLFRTENGKVIPFQPFSSKQSHHTKLVIGPMGFGKSVEMAADNWAFVLHPDNQELPYISIIDIGPSSRGFIELVRGLMPDNKKHLAVYERLQNTKEYAINIADTLLGLRFPLSNHKATIVNFLCSLALPDDLGAPPEGTIDVMERLVSLGYERLADRRYQLKYESGIDASIDATLTKLNFDISSQRVTWWDVTDYLFSHQDVHQAALAQRHAVPDISYFASLTNDPRIAGEFEDVSTSSGEKIANYVYRKLSSALNRYPILSARTQFDIGASKIISIDLDDVTKGAGTEAQIRTTVMYMLAYHTLTTHLYTGRDHLAEMAGEVGVYNVDYRPFHESRIASLERVPKRFQMDETHRGRQVTTFMQQLVTANLEGRKWGVDMVLGSQLTNGFPNEIKELATTVTILGAGNEANIMSLQQEFKLSETMIHYLRHAMRKPGRKGATLISLIDTNEGRLALFLYSSLGPRFLWAVNSVRSDSYVRNQLERKIGVLETRELLVQRYPNGTVNEEIEIRRRRRGETNRRFQNGSLINQVEQDDQTDNAILDEIIEDNLRYYEQHFRHSSDLANRQ